MAYETILVEQKDGIASITLNRPEVLNAFTLKMGGELMDALRGLKEDAETKVLILTGAGRAFCSGADIRGFNEQVERRKKGERSREPEGTEFDSAMPLTMINFPKPIIAAINGAAVGIGFTITLPCDLRIASENAKLGAVFTRVGLVPEFSSSYLLPKLIGLGKALELVLTARMIDAHEAKEIGLVNKVVPANTFMDETLAMAQMMAKGASVALKLAKRALHHGAGATMLQAMQYEHFAQAHCAETFDHEEAVRAFLEKREPRFQGK